MESAGEDAETVRALVHPREEMKQVDEEHGELTDNSMKITTLRCSHKVTILILLMKNHYNHVLDDDCTGTAEIIRNNIEQKIESFSTRERWRKILTKHPSVLYLRHLRHLKEHSNFSQTLFSDRRAITTGLDGTE